MKIPIVAVAITMSCSSVQAGGLRRAQGCPLPGAEIACTTLFDPVQCDVGCVYSNSCFATAAGWPAGTCPPVGGVSICPLPGSGTCPLDVRQLICGRNGCSYVNECFAERAGFVVDTDCVGDDTPVVCATVPPNANCLVNFNDPVLCGGCQYQSPCHAAAAGAQSCVSGGGGPGLITAPPATNVTAGPETAWPTAGESYYTVTVVPGNSTANSTATGNATATGNFTVPGDLSAMMDVESPTSAPSERISAP